MTNTNNLLESCKQLFYQTFFWLFIFVFYSLHYYRLIGSGYSFILFSGKELFIAMLSFYLWPGKWLGYRGTAAVFLSILLWIIAIFLAWSLLTYFLCAQLTGNTEIYPRRFQQYLNAITGLGPLGLIKEYKSFVYEILVLFILSISPRLFKMTIQEKVQKAKLERDHAEWELQLLKSQLNPPLLFNSLNKIYLLLEKDSDKGRDLIIRLSHLLRFTLYDSKSEFIEVAKEISFVNDFLILMRECFGESVLIDWEIQDIDEPYTIRPLLIIPIIDAAFNHKGNFNKTLALVSVKLRVDDNNCLRLNIECKSKITSQNNPNLASSYLQDSLDNVRKRLDMYYENRYLFHEEEFAGLLQITFNLDLKSY